MKKILGSGYLLCITLYVLCFCSFYVHYDSCRVGR